MYWSKNFKLAKFQAQFFCFLFLRVFEKKCLVCQARHSQLHGEICPPEILPCWQEHLATKINFCWHSRSVRNLSKTLRFLCIVKPILCDNDVRKGWSLNDSTKLNRKLPQELSALLSTYIYCQAVCKAIISTYFKVRLKTGMIVYQNCWKPCQGIHYILHWFSYWTLV